MWVGVTTLSLRVCNIVFLFCLFVWLFDFLFVFFVLVQPSRPYPSSSIISKTTATNQCKRVPEFLETWIS